MNIVCKICFLLMTALNAGSELEMQCSMDKFSSACDAFGLTITTKKMKVMYQPAPQEEYSEPSVTVNVETLKAVDKFTYLGSALARNVRNNDKVDHRIAKPIAAFGKLSEKVWERKGLSLEAKLKVYKAVVLPLLLYTCETWTVYSHNAKVINHFHQNCLRMILQKKLT